MNKKQRDKLAFESEQYLIPSSQLTESPEYPDEVNKFIRLAKGNVMEFLDEYGGSTGVAKHPEHGWIMLGTGQGPFVMWMENKMETSKDGI